MLWMILLSKGLHAPRQEPRLVHIRKVRFQWQHTQQLLVGQLVKTQALNQDIVTKPDSKA